MEKIRDAIVINIFAIILLIVLSYFFKESLSRIIIGCMRQQAKKLSKINRIEDKIREKQFLDLVKDDLRKNYRLILCEKDDNLKEDLETLKKDLIYLTEVQLDSDYVDNLSSMMIEIFKEYEHRQDKDFDDNKNEIHQKAMLLFNSLGVGSYDKEKIKAFENMG